MRNSLSNLTIAFVVMAIPFQCFAESYPRALARSDSRFDQAISRAKKEMVASLEREKLNIDERKFKTAELQQLAKELIKEEQAAFVTHGTLPFSTNTRAAARKYLSSIKKANIALTNAYASHQRQLMKLGKRDEAASIVDLRKRRGTPRLVARWKSTGRDKEHGETWDLYDDLSAEVFGSDGEKRQAAWNLDSSGLTLTTWAGGRQQADRWTVDPQGRSFVSKRGRQEIYRGELVSGSATSD